MIYIVRHGQTNYNLEKRITGRIDIELNETGKQEAKLLKEKLKDIQFNYVFSSPLKRCIQTAKIITNKKIIIDERLIERSNGKLEGVTKDELPLDVVFNDTKENKYGLEPISDIEKRVISFFNEINQKYPGKNILIVTHGGVIINMRRFLNGLPKSGNVEEYLCKNCEFITYKN